MHIIYQNFTENSFSTYAKFSEKVTFVVRRWFPNPGLPGSKPLGSSKSDLAFHSSAIDQISTRNFRGLSGKK